MTLFKSIHHNKHSFCSKYQLCELNQRKEIDIQQNILQNNFCDYFKFNSFEKILLARTVSSLTLSFSDEWITLILSYNDREIHTTTSGLADHIKSIYNRIFIGIKYILVLFGQAYWVYNLFYIPRVYKLLSDS